MVGAGVELVGELGDGEWPVGGGEGVAGAFADGVLDVERHSADDAV